MGMGGKNGDWRGWDGDGMEIGWGWDGDGKCGWEVGMGMEMGSEDRMGMGWE